MGDGMAPLALPEISSSNISPARRAALVADLPAGALNWSGAPLQEELCGFLKRGTDRDVWIAIVELMSRAGSTAWVDCLKDAIGNAEGYNQWMDEQFWARMILVVHRLIRAKPATRDQMRPPLEALVRIYDQAATQSDLQAMLDTTYSGSESMLSRPADVLTQITIGSGNGTHSH
jgi:hypothetical protein